MRLHLFALVLACASAPPKPAAPSGPAFTADQASAHVGESVTIEFRVVQVGHSKDSVFLNSQKYVKGEGSGFTGFIPKDARFGFEKAFGGDLKAALEGKTVRVTGKVKEYKGNPEMVLTSPDQLMLVP